MSEAFEFDRRTFIKGVTASLFAPQFAQEPPSFYFIPTYPGEEEFALQEIFPTIIEPAGGSGTLDKAYLESLLTSLQADGANANRQVEAVVENLCRVHPYRKDSNGNEFISSGTACRLDNEGYFLTAGHLMNNIPAPDFKAVNKAVVYNPRLGTVTLVKEFLIDFWHDVAILYAPTAILSSTVDIRLNFAPPQHDQKLWLYGINGYEPYLWASKMIALSGSVDLGVPVPPVGFKDPLYVKGMIPFGGASGGPVVDRAGRIIAVESGFFTETDTTPKLRENYLGARISPLANIDLLSMEHYVLSESKLQSLLTP